MTYVVTGTLHSYEGQFTGYDCWGISEDLTGNTYIFKYGNLPINWRVEGKRAHVTGEPMSILEPNDCIILGTTGYMTVTSVIDPDPVECTTNGDTKCIGTDKYVCNNGVWDNSGCDSICGCTYPPEPVPSMWIPIIAAVALVSIGSYYIFIKKEKF
jgi:hypothetical protein